VGAGPQPAGPADTFKVWFWRLFLLSEFHLRGYLPSDWRPHVGVGNSILVTKWLVT
jgi:hypothetical protein